METTRTTTIKTKMARITYKTKRIYDKRTGVVSEVVDCDALNQQKEYDPSRFIIEDIEVVCTDDGMDDELGQVCQDSPYSQVQDICFDDLDLTPEELEAKQNRKLTKPILVKEQSSRTVISSFSVPVVRNGNVAYHRRYELNEDGFYYCQDFDGLVYKKSIDQLLMML